MNTKNKIQNYSAVLDQKYGKTGTPERAQFDEEAYAFYTSQILLEARKEAKLTQAELAEKAGTDKAYISRIEKGLITPSVSTFFRIINILGKKIEIVWSFIHYKPSFNFKHEKTTQRYR